MQYVQGFWSIVINTVGNGMLFYNSGWQPWSGVYIYILHCLDGGQWDMAVNLITKHGLMPKECAAKMQVSNQGPIHMGGGGGGIGSYFL